MFVGRRLEGDPFQRVLGYQTPFEWGRNKRRRVSAGSLFFGVETQHRWE
jgi:hypothetical protein